MHLPIDRINQWLQILVLLTIPVEPIIINNVLIMLWGVATIIKPNKERYRDYTLWFITPFLLYVLFLVIGLTYSPWPLTIADVKFLENRAALLILPFLFLFSHPVDKDQALKYFVAVVCVLCLICLGGAIFNNIQYNIEHSEYVQKYEINPWFYTYMLYAGNVHLHPTYFSAFILLALIYLLGWRNIGPLRYRRWLLALFLGVNLLLLMSRVMVALGVVYCIVYLVFSLTSPIKKLAYLTVVGATIALIAMNPIVQLRVKDVIENQKSTFSGAQLKIQMWGSLYEEIISKNIMFGIGSSVQKERIKDVYKKHQIMAAYENEYNSHNQYIESLIYQGVIGLATLLILYGFYLQYAIKSGNHLLLAMMGVFVIGSLTESILFRQKGVVFFSFIVPFLAFNASKKPMLKPGVMTKLSQPGNV